MSPFDVGAFGFWMFIAAIILAGTWSSARKNAEKHETLRRIVEKTGTIERQVVGHSIASSSPTSSATVLADPR
jgi:hypothetical protein